MAWVQTFGGDDAWTPPTYQLDRARAAELRKGPLLDVTDVDAARSLLDVVHDDYEAYGTSGGERLNAKDIELAQKVLAQTLNRLGVELSLPWRNYSTFYDHWKAEGCANSYQKLRDLLRKHFDPVFQRLDALEQAQFESTVASGVSPRSELGWPAVDAEVAELQRRFQTAATPQDYRDVGNRCVAVLEAIGEVVYQPDKHLRDGETVPSCVPDSGVTRFV